MAAAVGDRFDFDQLALNLESEELDSPGCVTKPLVYAQLLAIYLLRQEPTHAKFLWKRIPVSVKSSYPELGLVWAVGQRMWQRDFPGIYESLRKDWSESLKPIMDAIRDASRKRAFTLVSRAYSCIGANDFSAVTGLPVNEAIDAAVSQGWKYDAGTRMLTPCMAGPSSEVVIPSDQHLTNLTNYVSFLEN